MRISNNISSSSKNGICFQKNQRRGWEYQMANDVDFKPTLFDKIRAKILFKRIKAEAFELLKHFNR